MKSKMFIDFVDYSLLDYFGELVINPYFLALPREKLIMAFNRPSHGLDKQSLIVHLIKLINEELLFVEQSTLLDDGGNAIKLPPDSITQERLLYEISKERWDYGIKRPNRRFKYYPDDIHLGLTALGGELWEDYFEVDWSKYILESSIDTGYSFESSNLLSINKIIEITSKYVTLNSEVETLEPYEATYWKVFPTGFRAKLSVSYRDRTVYSLFTSEERCELSQMRCWRNQFKSGKEVEVADTIITKKEQLKRIISEGGGTEKTGPRLYF